MFLRRGECGYAECGEYTPLFLSKARRDVFLMLDTGL